MDLALDNLGKRFATNSFLLKYWGHNFYNFSKLLFTKIDNVINEETPDTTFAGPVFLTH